jgi:hypothetical protein
MDFNYLNSLKKDDFVNFSLKSCNERLFSQGIAGMIVGFYGDVQLPGTVHQMKRYHSNLHNLLLAIQKHRNGGSLNLKYQNSLAP